MEPHINHHVRDIDMADVLEPALPPVASIHSVDHLMADAPSSKEINTQAPFITITHATSQEMIHTPGRAAELLVQEETTRTFTLATGDKVIQRSRSSSLYVHPSPTYQSFPTLDDDAAPSPDSKRARKPSSVTTTHWSDNEPIHIFNAVNYASGPLTSEEDKKWARVKIVRFATEAACIRSAIEPSDVFNYHDSDDEGWADEEGDDGIHMSEGEEEEDVPVPVWPSGRPPVSPLPMSLKRKRPRRQNTIETVGDWRPVVSAISGEVGRAEEMVIDGQATAR